MGQDIREGLEKHEKAIEEIGSSLIARVPRLEPDDGAVEWGADWWTNGDRFAPPVPSGDGERATTTGSSGR